MSADQSDTQTPPRRSLWRRLAKRLIPAAVVLGGVAFVVFVALLPARSREAPQREARTVPVEVVAVAPVSELADAVDLPGVVGPNRMVEVAAEVAGRIEHIKAHEGEPCKAGDVLVVLNTDLLKAEHDRAKSQAQFDAAEYKRVSEMHTKGIATRSELELARSKAQIAQANLDAAKAQLDRATIHAPIDGMLDELPVELGEYVQGGKVVAELVDLRRVKVKVDAPELDVGYLRVGQSVPILIDSLAEGSLTGEITFISELADEQTRTTPVEITVGNPGGNLRSGQIVRARLTRRILRDVIMIPLEAVIPLESGHAVYVVQEGRAQRRQVTLGLLRGSGVQVKAGLNVGDRLIVSGQRYVGPDQRVEVISAADEVKGE